MGCEYTLARLQLFYNVYPLLARYFKSDLHLGSFSKRNENEFTTVNKSASVSPISLRNEKETTIFLFSFLVFLFFLVSGDFWFYSSLSFDITNQLSWLSFSVVSSILFYSVLLYSIFLFYPLSSSSLNPSEKEKNYQVLLVVLWFLYPLINFFKMFPQCVFEATMCRNLEENAVDLH